MELVVASEEGEIPGKSGGLAEVLEGGLPQLLLGPAGKALSRFLGKGVDTLGAALWEYPKAAVDQKTQSIKDQTAARSAITSAVASSVASIAAKDPSILERGVENWIEKTYRAQSNKESIATKAYEQLEETPPPPDAGEIDQDWLNVFSRFAEDASSTRLQETFAQILAGETRRPGSISLATVQFLSVLDQRTAEAINKGFSWAIDGSGLLPELTDDYETFVALRDSGLVATHLTDMQITLEPKGKPKDWVFTMSVGPTRLWVEFPPETKLKLGLIALSRTGQELFRVIPVAKDDQALAAGIEKLKGAGANSASLVVPRGDDMISRGQTLWKKSE